jgi:hypothetical protein
MLRHSVLFEQSSYRLQNQKPHQQNSWWGFFGGSLTIEKAAAFAKSGAAGQPDEKETITGSR